MSKRSKLAKELRMIEEEIRFLEIKRSRSMASLLESLISRAEPNAEDVQFFRNYTAEIEVKRQQLQQVLAQLEQIV